jgi:hypothetical protein
MMAREEARTVIGERKNVRLSIAQHLFYTSFLRQKLDEALFEADDPDLFPEGLSSAARIPE